MSFFPLFPRPRVNLQIPAFVRELITCPPESGGCPGGGGHTCGAGSTSPHAGDRHRQGVRWRDKATGGAVTPEPALFQAPNSAQLIFL